MLSQPARAALRALCQRIVPDAFRPDNMSAGEDLLARVEARIAALPAGVAKRTAWLLAVVATRRGAFLFSGRPVAFIRATAPARDQFLDAWQNHPSATIRGGFHGVRKLILWTWWESAAPRAEIGWLGPLHRREPQLPWEGPLRGAPEPGEPVLHNLSGSLPAQDPARDRPSLTQLVLNAEVLSADVCIIGSGAGGSVMADRLVRGGLDVLLLEAGPSWSPQDSDEEEATMVRRLYADGGTRATDDQSITLFQGECLGGGTTVNWMLMLRPPDHVMEEWERARGLDLLCRASLVPALERIEAEVNAALIPREAHSAQNRALLDGAMALGWRVEEARINARSCVRAGTCGLGCRWGAKQSATQTFLPRAVSGGARVICNAAVDHIEAPAAAGSTRVVHFIHRDGTTALPRRVEARTVVLSAGAIGTPAVLQRSGLGGGGVGRFLRLHPTTAVVGAYDRDMYGGAGIPQSSLCTEFLDDGGGFGFWIECPPFQPALAAAALPGFGAAHARRMQEYRRMAAFIVLVRDGAPPGRDASQGRVTMMRNGGISIRYSLRSAEWLRMARGMAACARMHLAAGARTAMGLYDGAQPVDTDAAALALGGLRHARNRIALFSAHVNGTCRMGVDPGQSGCDPEGRRHGVRDVFVADGSVFPSAPAANPQAAIMAIASLVAERILH